MSSLILFLSMSIFSVVAGLACLGASEVARTEKKKKALLEWGEAFVGISFFPILIILIGVLG